MGSNLNLLPKQRVEYIDLLKCFGIFCVLWTHSIGDLRTSNDEWFFLADPIMKFLIAHNMPLFFMISGFLFSASFDLSFKDFLKKKSACLLIPHVTWSILIGVLYWVMTTFVGWERSFDTGKSFSLLSQIQAFFRPDPADELYFFKDLFLTGLIAFTAYKIFKKRSAAFIASMVFVLFVSFFGVVGKIQRFMMPIFWAGILLRTYHPVFSKHLNKILIASGIAFAVCLYFYDHTYEIYIMDFPTLINFSQSLVEGKIVFNFTNIGISVFRSFTGIVGSVFFFALFQRFWKKNKVTSYFSRCGQITIGVYGIQSIMLHWIMHNLLDFVNVNIWIYRFLITPSIAAFIFFVCIGVIRLIQRNRPLTFILFGNSLVKSKIAAVGNQTDKSVVA